MSRLDVTSLEREFRFEKDNGTKVKLPDPNKDFSVQEVLQFYSGQYPELTTANFESPVVEGKKAVYDISTTVGTKG